MCCALFCTSDIKTRSTAVTMNNGFPVILAGRGMCVILEFGERARVCVEHPL